jgi:membrane protease YdiL (CAAX protease family)
MFAQQLAYFRSTRHPCPCLLFLVPLLIAYEAGVVKLGGAHADMLRNGADAWLRWALDTFGLRQLYGAPALVALILVVWSWLRRTDVPKDLLGVVTGMVLESVFFALGLWALSQVAAPYLSRLGTQMSTPTQNEVAMGQVITFVGAGIYEEVLFRLVLFSALNYLLRLAKAPLPIAIGFAAVASAACFSAAHHIGPYGDPFDSTVFLFRLLAGLYFAFLFQLRGFGIAVGAHACYDVLVGVAIG